MGGTCSKCKKHPCMLIENICGDCYNKYDKTNVLLYYNNLSIQKYLYNSEINIKKLYDIINENIKETLEDYCLVYIIPLTNNQVIITNENIFDFLLNNTLVFHLKPNRNNIWK
jgi:hypothetical protein